MATSVIYRSAPNANPKPWASSSANTRQTQQKPSSLTCAWRKQCRDSLMRSSILGLSSPSVQKPASFSPLACLSSSSSSPSSPKTSTKLYVSGLSFRTTEESLRNAFQNFGQLVEVNLVMDRIANRPRGFAFLRYASEKESQSAIEGMHGKTPKPLGWRFNKFRFIESTNKEAGLYNESEPRGYAQKDR